MKKFITIAIIFITILSATVLIYKHIEPSQEVRASSLCPEDMNDIECYEYLNKKQNDIAKQKKDIEKRLKDVKKQEASLSSQIEYLKDQISANELEIQSKQVKIELISIEIRNLKNQLEDAQQKIELYQQEIQNLKDSINNYVYLKQYLNTVPWYYYLANGDIYSAFEVMEYLDYFINENEAKKQHMANVQKQLQDQKEIIANAKQEVEEKRNEIEKENLELIKLQENLKTQKKKQQNLLAQLKDAEAAYKAKKTELAAVENEVDKALTDVLLRMQADGTLPSHGFVKKGTIIGYQGHTGCSFGSHLHFAILKGSYPYYHSINPFTSGYLSVSGRYLKSGSKAIAPEAGAYITQWFHSGYALDMLSTTTGDHSGKTYCKNKYEIKCPSYIYQRSWFKSLPTYACFRMNGEGAPIYAIMDGTLYRGVDKYGSKYVLIDHGNGVRSIYYHLK